MIEFLDKHRILRFLITGSSGAALNIGLLFIFTEFFGWWYLVSATAAFLLSIVFGFSAHKLWTFKDSSTDRIPGQFSIYLGLMLFNLAANAGILYTLVEKFEFWYIFGQVVTSLIIAVWSFFAYKWLFKRRIQTEMPT
ncbi:MAG: GtrA family protein [Minisyncoccia bacterium]